MTLQSASDLLKRAVELDTALKYSESLICYEEGIQMLIRLMRGGFPNNSNITLTLRTAHCTGMSFVINNSTGYLHSLDQSVF